MNAGSHAAECVRVLAGLLRSGLAVPDALAEWHRHVPSGAAGPLRRAAGRLRLGASPARVVGDLGDFLGPDCDALSGLVDAHLRSGGDLARMLDSYATSVQERVNAAARAHNAGSGARASGRLIAALPALVFPLTPLSHAPLFDGVGLVCLFAGSGLVWAGMAWIERLVPRPPPGDDPAAYLADLTASMLRGGVGLEAALVAATRAPDGAPADGRVDNAPARGLGRARRMARLGRTWPDALATAGPGFEALGTLLERAAALGIPAATALEGFAAHRREEGGRTFENAARRAPVFMVVPLAVCVLPAFVLLCVVPFLRGLALRG